jgi:hypothetical protein
MLGCQHVDPNPGEMAVPTELTQNPQIFVSSPADWSKFSLNSLHIGDDAKRINPNKISSSDEKSGWTILRDANRYRVRDGKIDGLGIWDQTLLQQLGVQTQDDIPAKFGKPESVAKISPNVTIYQYQDGHLHVFWNSLEHRLVGVEVTK